MQETDVSEQRYGFREVNTAVSEKTGRRHDIRDIVIRSNVLYLTVLLNQPARQHNTSSQNMSNFFSKVRRRLQNISCNRNEPVQILSTWQILKRSVKLCESDMQITTVTM